MKRLVVEKATPFSIVCDAIAPDKSISHRCAIFSLLSDQDSQIENYLLAEDTLCSLKIVEALGAAVHREEGRVQIVPPKHLEEPDDLLDCGNAGTAMRLFCGFLSGVSGHFVLTGDRYLRRRPMRRVVDPLRRIGAKIDGRKGGDLAPLCIRGGALEPFDYQSPIASAQVKSAMILAALRAKAPSTFQEPFLSRDHTERMLLGMGATLQRGETIVIHPLDRPLQPIRMRVPADPSSAFFFAVAAAIIPGSDLLIREVTLNPTRIEAYRALERMGVSISYQLHHDRYEPIGDIRVQAPRKLRGIKVDTRIAWLIDELPALAIAMAVAEGESWVRNAKELRIKESDRIACVVQALQQCGIDCEAFEDGYRIKGGQLQHAQIDSCGDHRIAMSFAIAGLVSGMEIKDIACIATSFPNFIDLLGQITRVRNED